MTDFRLTAAKYLRKERALKYVCLLGKGSYGTVIQMRSEELGMVAVKLVSKRLANSLEIERWKELNHSNILQLLFVDQALPDCVIFVTELMSRNLTKQMEDKSYREDPSVLFKIKRYLKDVLNGLDYLHSHHLCHLDLRADNIFLGFDDRAVIADFSGLCRSNEKKNFCPLPRCFRPPEMLKTNKKVWPRPIDLWSFGLLTAHVFLLKRFYKITLNNGNVGSVESTKFYVEAFQDREKIMACVKRNFPLCKVPLKFCEELVSFIGQFLQTKPSKRCKADEALCHSFIMSYSEDQPTSSSDIDWKSIPCCSSANVNDSGSKIKATLPVSTSTDSSSESSRDTRRLLSTRTVGYIHENPESSIPVRIWKSSEAFSHGKCFGSRVRGRSVDGGSVCHDCTSIKEMKLSFDRVTDTYVNSVQPMIKAPSIEAKETADFFNGNDISGSSQQEENEDTTRTSASCARTFSGESTEFLLKDSNKTQLPSSKEVSPQSTQSSRWLRFRNRFHIIKDILRRK